MISPFRPSKYMKPITKRDIADRQVWVNVCLFISATCTTAAAPNGCIRDTLQIERGTCALPFNRCRCSQQGNTYSRMRSWTVPCSCGGRRCSSNDRRHSQLNPVAWAVKCRRNWAALQECHDFEFVVGWQKVRIKIFDVSRFRKTTVDENYWGFYKSGRQKFCWVNALKIPYIFS